MDLIRIYQNSLDIKPKVMLGHFLRYLGFCTEEVSEWNRTSGVESLIDIYVISDKYMENRETGLDIKNEEKTILILMDGWGAKTSSAHKVFYDTKMKDIMFLHSLIDEMAIIFEQRRGDDKRLIYSVADIKGTITTIANVYTNRKILPSVLYTRCFYRNMSLYRFALDNYKKFLNDMENATYKDSDLMKYVRTYAMFELNSISKMNLEGYYYSLKDMLQTSSELCEKYPKNEQVHFLQADMYLELDDFWAGAANEYAESCVSHCAYAHYKRGRILRKYLEDNRSALAVLKKAIYQKGDYFAAWYQVAICYEELGMYEEAVNALKKICHILDEKYKKHLLAPIDKLHKRGFKG